MLKVIHSEIYKRCFEPIGNHLEDIYIGLVRIVKTRSIHEHQIVNRQFWKGKSDDANFARARL